MTLGHDQRVPAERRIPVQEGDAAVVFVDDVVAELGVPREQLADEAAVAEPPSQLFEVDPPSTGQL
jgi:hypothetical protein